MSKSLQAIVYIMKIRTKDWWESEQYWNTRVPMQLEMMRDGSVQTSRDLYPLYPTDVIEDGWRIFKRTNRKIKVKEEDYQRLLAKYRKVIGNDPPVYQEKVHKVMNFHELEALANSVITTESITDALYLARELKKKIEQMMSSK